MTDLRGNGVARVGAGWGWILLYGIASTVIGFCAFIWPFSATVAATLVVGGFLTVAGALSLAAGLFGHGHEGRGYTITFGILSLIVGIWMLFEPVTGAISLTLLVAVWLLVRGIMEIVWGARMQRHKGMMILLGVVNIILAIVVFATMPVSALTLPGYILGISFLFGGITSIIGALSHRSGAEAFATPS